MPTLLPLWSANVEDEQGKINLISVAPRVLGSMLRSDTLAADVVPEDRLNALFDAGTLRPSATEPAPGGGLLSWYDCPPK